MFEFDRRVKRRHDLFSELQQYRKMIQEDTDFQELKSRGIRVEEKTMFVAALYEYSKPDVIFD